MPVFNEQRVLAYSREQIFQLVADVESYPYFLPWCIDCKKIADTHDGFQARMYIGFNLFRESFISEVKLAEPESINVFYKDGPFKYLNNYWKFQSVNSMETEVDFHIDFEFRSIFFEALMGIWFEEAVKRMIRAFEERAEDLYS